MVWAEVRSLIRRISKIVWTADTVDCAGFTAAKNFANAQR